MPRRSRWTLNLPVLVILGLSLWAVMALLIVLDG